MNRRFTQIVSLFLMSIVAVSISAQSEPTEETWSQAGLDLAMGEMSNATVDEAGIHLAMTGDTRSYTSSNYIVELRETTAVYTSTIADMGAEATWMNIAFTHSVLYHDDFGEYDVAFEARTKYAADTSWSDWIDLTPPIETTTCAIMANPYQSQIVDGSMMDLTIPGGRMVCFASTNLGGVTLLTEPYIQYRITITTESNESNVTVNNIKFIYETTDPQSQDESPSAVSVSHIHTTTLSLTLMLTLILTLTLTGLTYGTYLDIRFRR